MFKKRKRNNKEIDVSENVTLKKWVAFQRADIVFTMIGQMPVLLQYFFSGGFEAGVVSIVLLIKKLINFITGPTAKIFLPEFSKLYHAGKKEEIRKIFAAIMQLQMLFVGPLAVMLIGFPNVILNIWAEELLQYTKIFSVCSMIFLIATTLGPCGGVMQMTGNENKDNRYREVALVAMAVVMIVFSKNHLFVLYGLCAQTAIEATGKYIFVCKWMEKAPIKIGKYISWWIAPTLAIVMGRMLRLHSSYVLMLILAGVVFVITFVIELCDDKGILYTMVERRGRNVSQNRVD